MFECFKAGFVRDRAYYVARDSGNGNFYSDEKISIASSCFGMDITIYAHVKGEKVLVFRHSPRLLTPWETRIDAYRTGCWEKHLKALAKTAYARKKQQSKVEAKKQLINFTPVEDCE